MADIAIHVEGLGKRYRLGQREPYKTLRDTLARAATASIRALSRGRGAGQSRDAEAFWALRDVSFEVKQGEVLGIIGRNGAGKSTLLKIFSRITDPTEGSVRMHGRVGSLLEVGTGFHPELTGRENVYLNGAILGMKRREIGQRFDEIVQFAGIEKFLDTPVKRYSSGMYVRLAFAVAAHLEPEILVVDEVLAVGDTEFQRKCLKKIHDVTQEGRTALFISHNLQTIKVLCQRAILLDGGRVKVDGAVDDVISTYLTLGRLSVHKGMLPSTARRVLATGEAFLKYVALQDSTGSDINEIISGQRLQVIAEYEMKMPTKDIMVEIGITTLDGYRIATITNIDKGEPLLSFSAGLWNLKVDVDLSLLPGQYAVDVFIHNASTGLTIDWVEQTFTFTVIRDPKANDHRALITPERGFPVRGYVRPPSVWEVTVKELSVK